MSENNESKLTPVVDVYGGEHLHADLYLQAPGVCAACDALQVRQPPATVPTKHKFSDAEVIKLTALGRANHELGRELARAVDAVLVRHRQVLKYGLPGEHGAPEVVKTAFDALHDSLRELDGVFNRIKAVASEFAANGGLT